MKEVCVDNIERYQATFFYVMFLQHVLVCVLTPCCGLLLPYSMWRSYCQIVEP